MHERLERFTKDHIQHPADAEITSLVETHGFVRICAVLAFDAIKRSKEPDNEADDHTRSSLRNGAWTLLNASDQFC